MPSAPVAAVLAKVQKARKLSSGGWVARCPAHDDREPSLSIMEGTDGRALLTCHAGCEVRAIAAAMGMAVSELFTPSTPAWTAAYTPPPASNGATAPRLVVVPHREPTDDHDDKRSWPVVATYDYVDDRGALVFQVVRKEPPVQLTNGKRRKTFMQRQPGGPGGWTYGLAGIETRPLYRLPELLEDLGAERTILLVEGEKDCDTVRRLGFAGAAHMGGSKAWRPEYAATLAGADVVILPDNDEPGRDWAATAGAALIGSGCRVRILALPVRAEGADVTDWAEAGGTAAHLERLLGRAIPWTIGDLVPLPPLLSRFRLVSDLELENLPPLRWLADGIWPAGSLLATYGAPGCGKSFLAVDLACCIATGLPWFGRTVVHGPVLYVAAEGGTGFRTRIAAWKQAHGFTGQSIDIMFVLEPANLWGSEDVRHLLRAVDLMPVPPVFVVMDTLARCIVGGDENSAQDMGLVIEHADQIKRETGASVKLVHHSRKDGDQERGSIALRAGVDTLAMVREDEDGRRTLACEKQKDHDPFESIPFMLTSTGDSCVVKPYDPRADVERLTPRRRAALDTLMTLFAKGASATEWMKGAGLPERTFYDVRAWLVRHGYVSESERGSFTRYAITESGKWALGTSR